MLTIPVLFINLLCAYASYADDPEIFMDFCQLANYNGYNCEEHLHKVHTEDGYLLTMQRINGRIGEKLRPNRPPVLLQHGLIADSVSFVLNNRNESLPFLLSDAGFDCWFGNNRGTTKSSKHIFLNITEKAFWDFSWQEMAEFDLPAEIDYVLEKVQRKSLHYIGHSQGTLQAFVHLATTNSTKIEHLIALAPIFRVTHLKGPLRLVAPFKEILGAIFEDIDAGSFMPYENSSQWEATHLCNHPLLNSICEDVLFATCGVDTTYTNVTRLPVYAAHTPEGTSVKDVLHYGQMLDSGNCQMWDYGSKRLNRKHYGYDTPPIYDETKISTPVSLFWAENDFLADPTDVGTLRARLRNVKNDVYIPKWDHADFVIGFNTKEAIGTKIIDILQHDLL